MANRAKKSSSTKRGANNAPRVTKANGKASPRATAVAVARQPARPVSAGATGPAAATVKSELSVGDTSPAVRSGVAAEAKLPRTKPGAAVAQPRSADGARDSRLPTVGTTLIKRDRNGAPRCECVLEAAGYRYKGSLYRSLSAAASAAATDLGANSRVNGFVFWGLVKPARPAKAPADQLRKIAARYEEHAATFYRNGKSDDEREVIRRELQTCVARLEKLVTELAA